LNLTLRFALAYAARGWYSFPVRNKRAVTTRGLYDASIDPGQLREWFADTAFGIAIHPGPSGLSVVDVDPRNHGPESLRAYPEFPVTPTVLTGRGDGGCHYYFSALEGTDLKNGEFGKGLDFKGHGGYVVAPPSIHGSGGTYTWTTRPSMFPLAPLPSWVAGLRERTEPLPAPLPRPNHAPGPGPLGRASRYLSAMNPSVSGSGGHNALLTAANALVNGFELTEEESVFLLATEFNLRCRPVWPIRELQRKVREAGRLPPRHGRGWLLDRPAP